MEARDRVRWFPAIVSNHVVDLVNRYPSDRLPESLTGCLRDRGSDDRIPELGASGGDFVSDEVVDRFAVVGPAKAHVRRLVELREAGIDQFNLYLMSGDEEAQLEADGSCVIPHSRWGSTAADPSEPRLRPVLLQVVHVGSSGSAGAGTRDPSSAIGLVAPVAATVLVASDRP